MNDRDVRPSFGTALQDMRLLFPPSLLSGVCWERLLERARELPVAAADSTFGFEVRLDDDEPGADFCVTIPRSGEMAAHYSTLAGQPEAAMHDAQAGLLAPEDALASCIREIARPGTFAHRAVEDGLTMLEYDVVNVPAGQHPSPGVFWNLDEHADQRDVADLARLLALAAGTTPASARTETMRRVFGIVATFGRVASAGTFVGRQEAGVRLITSDVEVGSLAGCLDALRWPGSIPAATNVVATCAPHAGRMRLALALDLAAGGLGPRIGLELKFPGNWTGTRPSDWRPLVETLVTKGWCRPGKAVGVLQWMGLERLFGRERMHLVARGISHIKIDIRGDAAGAKAYLAASRMKPRVTGREAH